MSNEIMQENTPFVECSAFHRGMSVLEANLRNTEDSEAIISGLLKGAAEFYGASKECTTISSAIFTLHQATASLNCFHVISFYKNGDPVHTGIAGSGLLKSVDPVHRMPFLVVAVLERPGIIIPKHDLCAEQTVLVGDCTYSTRFFCDMADGLDTNTFSFFAWRTERHHLFRG